MLRVTHVDPLLLGLGFGLALGLAALLTPVVARWATAGGVVAKPRQDRWHKQPTPMLGGIAIYVASTLSILAFAPLDWRLAGVLGGGALLFVTGLVDDLRRLRPQTKLIVQIVAACVLVVAGVRVETSTLAMVAIPLTIIWVVGITNAFNLLDNMDGLSAGTAAIAAFFLLGFSVSVGNAGTAILCLAIAGGALGFLIYNFNPARIFMGDSGSMYLGFMLSAIALLGTREMASDVFFVLLVPAAMMGLPIFDTTLVSIMRTIEGRPLSQGGRDHLSHRLVALGLSERQAVLLLYLLAASFGSLGLIARSVGFWASLAAAGSLLAAAVVFGAYLAQVRIYRPAEFAKAERSAQLSDRPVINGMIMFKRELGLVLLDFVLICVAYLGSFLLRFGSRNATIPPAVGELAPLPDLFSQTVPLVVVVQLGALFAFQAYRGMWRYVGVADLLTITKVTATSGLVLLALFPILMPRLVVPKSVLLIDWLFLTVLLTASRVSFTALTDTFGRLQKERLPHILIVGAGDLGELVLRSVLRSRPTVYQAVGFVDPDPGKRNRSIHGVRVVGTVDDLDDLVEAQGVDLVVVALAHGADLLADEVHRRCEELGIRSYPAATFVEMHFAGGPALATDEAQPTIQPTTRD